MKITLASRALNALAVVLIGTPQSLFSVPIEDFWVLENDRTPPEPDETGTATWQRRRVFELNLRRRMAMPVAVVSSLLATAVVVVGLLALAGTTGIHNAYVAHHAAAVAQEAQEKAVQAQVDAAAQKCADYSTRATTLDAASKDALARQGCDVATGKLDESKFKKSIGGDGQ